MRQIAVHGSIVVIGHFLFNAWHGLAHTFAPVPTTALQQVFIIPVIFVAPLLAMALLWTRYQRAGVLLLIISLTSSLVFGVINHFIVQSVDHVLLVPQGPWARSFQLSAVLVTLTQIVGIGVGITKYMQLDTSLEIAH